jgi:YVTN family beta-propeller protein
MRRSVPAILAAAALAAVALSLAPNPRVGVQPDGSIIVPTGQTITPAGAHIEVADRPLGMAVSPGGDQLAVVTGSNFGSRRVHLIDLAKDSITQSIAIGNSFVGVAFSNDVRHLYVGGGADNNVKFFLRREDGTYSDDGVAAIPGSAPSGLSLSPDGEWLYVALNTRHALGIVHTQTRAVKEVPVGSYPYTTAVTADGAKVYVSNWGGRRADPGDATEPGIPVVVDPKTGVPNNGTVSVIDAKSQRVIKQIEVGLHPSAMLLSRDGARLLVANANSDTVSLISTETDTVVRTLDVRLFEGAPLGSAPNALALSPDGRTLYVANAANNAVAVVEPDHPSKPLRGFIPTGWFPTAVAVANDGRRLFIASGYGFGSIAAAKGSGRSYTNRVGVVSILGTPGEAQLAAYTLQVMRNNRAPGAVKAATAPRKFPIPVNRAEASPIKHVFYIIKENRTYDQLFGDLAQGNGDATLVQFGREVSPNHHALAEQFVLLDNFYVVGDQSSLGHQWTDESYANDYSHKYGNARNDFAGTNPMAYAPTGFIWDHARNHGKTVRIYGEFTQSTRSPAGVSWTDIYSAWKEKTAAVTIGTRTRVASVRDIMCPEFPGFDMRITDQWRIEVFLREFREYERNGNLPNLVVMLLPDDHTNGTSPGFPTPRAMVADNDLALGRIVEAISKSKYWNQSVILVTEDDAQAGLDHVDGHRTIGLAIGPYVKRKAVDSSLYTSIHMFRTIEQILGLAPLNQYDLAAEPMFSVFTAQPDSTPYKALPNRIPLDEMNPPVKATRGLQRQLALESMKMDFTEPDAAPEQLLNRVIWHSVKGYDVPYPAR